jgi:glycosyltransferase involved in cell wall biosynthesis
MASDVPVFVALSSLVPFKGLHHLVRAMRHIRDAGVEARLVLAGTGLEDSYEAWLRSLPRELGVADRVCFVGFVENVTPLLVACDALVLPSVETEHLEFDGTSMRVQGNEGLPRSILEAMAAGRTVVATDIAGVREQVEPGSSGVVVAPGDVRALADAMIRVARDAEFRRDAGQRALEIVRERFTVEMAGCGLLEVLREAAQPRPMLARASAAAAVLLERHQAS